MKKIYSKPEILVVESQIEYCILAGSKLYQSFGQKTNNYGWDVIDKGVKNEDESDGSVFGKRTGGDLWE